MFFVGLIGKPVPCRVITPLDCRDRHAEPDNAAIVLNGRTAGRRQFGSCLVKVPHRRRHLDGGGGEGGFDAGSRFDQIFKSALRGHFGINAERFRRGVGWPDPM
ncbi:hypothetical protein AruPA_19655 [Acidiphilium sp. PA]|uniref:hypothetical protein n=1 Tax=Acidiphilium sp. PA TaxID=2871705 RepID=UPI0022440489|nr:hypothetical protein [Acidiphilium sp. PA]MCW8309253.1 hypothetical protein [Acidiphilium sp. PA]